MAINEIIESHPSESVFKNMYDNIFEAVAYNYPIFNIAFGGGEGDNIAFDKQNKTRFCIKILDFSKSRRN